MTSKKEKKFKTKCICILFCVNKILMILFDNLKDIGYRQTICYKETDGQTCFTMGLKFCIIINTVHSLLYNNLLFFIFLWDGFCLLLLSNLSLKFPEIYKLGLNHPNKSKKRNRPHLCNIFVSIYFVGNPYMENYVNGLFLVYIHHVLLHLFARTHHPLIF